ncbi:unnamed protein product [Thelazia callipaeda]|uniref:DUF2326 domain-containing protein n=1 Tax=Thelazia callipaeda TaxID=103827 RepID=A0A158RD60_THECL|nr:unnamed protein product [Thelazia callipaeda]
MISLSNHLQKLLLSGLVSNCKEAIALRCKVIAKYVVQSLNDYGWAVVDNFLDENNSRSIFREIDALHKKKIFEPGQLMKIKDNSNSRKIRSDNKSNSGASFQIYWFDSSDKHVDEVVMISLLLSMIDSIVLYCDGYIPYEIVGRSRVML